MRRGIASDRVTAFFDRHLAARRLVTIGPRAVRATRTVVAMTSLRAADALYVWVAAHENLPLVTADREVITRASSAGVRALEP